MPLSDPSVRRRPADGVRPPARPAAKQEGLLPQDGGGDRALHDTDPTQDGCRGIYLCLSVKIQVIFRIPNRKLKKNLLIYLTDSQFA